MQPHLGNTTLENMIFYQSYYQYWGALFQKYREEVIQFFWKNESTIHNSPTNSEFESILDSKNRESFLP